MKPLVEGLVLKFIARDVGGRCDFEAPRGGAGIEISTPAAISSRPTEAPRGGAGIEIMQATRILIS